MSPKPKKNFGYSKVTAAMLISHFRGLLIVIFRRIKYNEEYQVISLFFNDTHREKLLGEGFTQFSTRNGWLAASDLFHVFAQSIKVYTFNYYLLRVPMFEKWDSSNRQ